MPSAIPPTRTSAVQPAGDSAPSVSSFERIVDDYQRRLYGFALRMTGNREDAEEIVQDAFVRAFRALGKMSPEQRTRNAEAAKSTLRDMERAECALHELRQARQRSQEDLARTLKVQQPAVAKLEHRADMYVSNLRRYIEALGGTLEITARFPDGEVTITNFRDVGRDTDSPGAVDRRG